MRYAIVNIENVVESVIEGILETSSSTLRQSLDGSQVVVKYNSEKPDILKGVADYSEAEILTIMANSSWSEQS